MGDSNSDGTIVNPGADYNEVREDEVGDAGDEANDLRFNEEQALISEQSHLAEDSDDAAGDAEA